MGLGQGLASIMQSHQNRESEIHQDENGNTVQIEKINLDLIDSNPYQPRKDFSEEELQELANTLKEQGLIQPITVRKFGGRYQIVSGERHTGRQELPDFLR